MSLNTWEHKNDYRSLKEKKASTEQETGENVLSVLRLFLAWKGFPSALFYMSTQIITVVLNKSSHWGASSKFSKKKLSFPMNT